MQMNGIKFTEGPWVFNSNDGSITDCTAAKNEIAIVQTQGWDKLGMGCANGNLIAAATDLYDTLVAIRLEISPELWVSVDGDEVLKKARGE
jgi:hypothetical protein